MAKTLPISEVKARLPELVAGVQEREEEKQGILLRRSLRRTVDPSQAAWPAVADGSGWTSHQTFPTSSGTHLRAAR